MKPQFRRFLGGLVIAVISFALTSCGVNMDQFPRDIDPARQSELNGK